MFQACNTVNLLIPPTLGGIYYDYLHSVDVKTEAQ